MHRERLFFEKTFFVNWVYMQAPNTNVVEAIFGKWFMHYIGAYGFRTEGQIIGVLVF
jgi:lipid-A-disaccharide synthase-like uncharacterized protein